MCPDVHQRFLWNVWPLLCWILIAGDAPEETPQIPRLFNPFKAHLYPLCVTLNLCSVAAKDSSVHCQTGFYGLLIFCRNNFGHHYGAKHRAERIPSNQQFLLPGNMVQVSENNRNHSGFWRSGQVSARASWQNLTLRVSIMMWLRYSV